MMSLEQQLDQQIAALIQDAPDDGEVRQLIATIAPALLKIAGRLRHLQYYVAETQDQAWVRVTLSHRTQPTVEKTVIYGFSAPEDVFSGSVHQEPDLTPVAIPVIDLLFRVWALNLSDSLICFETPGDTTHATEITRSEFERSLREMFQIPPDLA